jgi:putative flippase GtrA
VATRDLLRATQLIRYYQAGLLNAGFGFGVYALLIWLGFHPYLAQALSHVTGIAFNYITYKRHVFSGSAPAKQRFVLAYAANYGLSVLALAVLRSVIGSAYAAGLATIVLVSAINFFVLRHLVFIQR